MSASDSSYRIDTYRLAWLPLALLAEQDGSSEPFSLVEEMEVDYRDVVVSALWVYMLHTYLGLVRNRFGGEAERQVRMHQKSIFSEEKTGAGEAVESALDGLHQMRVEEGEAMAADLEANCGQMVASLDEVQRRAPLVVEAYRARLEERLNRILAEIDVSVEQADVLKEVGLFADRCDISEEITRLRSHLDQFRATMQSDESSGRKLEFLTQEIVREVNTIGSKASDVEISRHVVEMKAAAERIREMIQNVE